ncbi:MAG: NAD-dependent epimerase/dehydratase family protein [Bacteroidales bacterium]|nr:NAD-dependent epimerase/dehydratase family protein [Bacteroidales bacterium]
MIIVTGGTGLVGSHLLFELLKTESRVKAIKRSESNFNLIKKLFSYYSNDYEKIFSRIDWINADVCDLQALTNAMKGTEKVYHCAAVISFHKKDFELMLKTNVEGTKNIVQATLENKIKKLCYVSSIASIGRAKREIDEITEETPWEESPHNSNYSKSKYFAEKEIYKGIEKGLESVIVNPAVIIGPGDWKKGSANLIYTVNEGMKYYTLGVNGYVDVRDVVKSMIQLMNSEIKNERFIISSENLTYKNLFFLIADSLNCKRPYIRVNSFISKIALAVNSLLKFFGKDYDIVTPETARTANSKYFYSNNKIKEKLGFEFIPIKKSIEDTCKFFLKEIKQI